MVNRSTTLPEQIAALEQRIAVLEQKRLIAGNELRITEVSETMLLIERIPDDPEAESVSERLDQAEETLCEIRRSDWVAGEGLITKDNGLQKVIELDPAFLNQSQPAANNKDILNDFPFRVRLDDTQPESGTARNFLLCAGGYDLPDALVYAGTTEPVRVEKHTFQTDQDCGIFLRITLSPEASEISPGMLDVSVEQGDSFPPPTAKEYIVPIAKIIFEKNGFVIQQMQFGNVYLAGRVI